MKVWPFPLDCSNYRRPGNRFRASVVRYGKSILAHINPLDRDSVPEEVDGLRDNDWQSDEAQDLHTAGAIENRGQKEPSNQQTPENRPYELVERGHTR